MTGSNFIIDIDAEADELEEGIESASVSELREWTVDVAMHGTRIDHALSEMIPEFSRNYLRQLIEAGAMKIGGKVVLKPSNKVRAGDKGSIELRPTPQSQSFKPEPVDIDVVFEDEFLLVLNKPAGLVVHPAPGNWSGTLLNGLLHRFSEAALLPRAGIVHRLDKDTSGLMVVAKTRSTMDELVRMIAARSVNRQYLAIAEHPWQLSKNISIDEPIGRDPKNRLRMAVLDAKKSGSKQAKTDFFLLKSSDSGCLLKCTLHTGRTHQIRVHLAHIKHPLTADIVYGGRPNPIISRQALHAFILSFIHPVTAQAIHLQREPPLDFISAMENWGLGYNFIDC